MLLCPVRDCHLALTREERLVMCARGHSFDIARNGYINLPAIPRMPWRRGGGCTIAA
jgi:hypothetical protein